MSGSSVIRRVGRHLRGKRFHYDQTFFNHSENYKRTVHVVTLFYVFSFLFGITESGWGWPDLAKSQFFEVIWPFELFRPWIVPVLIPIGFWGWIVGSFICILNSRLWWARALQALGVFVIVGLRNSDGHFGHSFHALLWFSIALAFLPAVPRGGPGAREARHHYIQIFWMGQFFICVFYMMTGIWKIRSLAECVVVPGLQCELSEKVLTNLGAQELVEYRKFAPLSWVLFEHPWVAFFSYMGTIWIHMFSLHFLCRPRLHLLFGFLRIVFHLGTLALFGINFAPFTWTVIVAFVFSPFHRDGIPLWRLLCDLPPFDIFIRRARALTPSKREITS